MLSFIGKKLMPWIYFLNSFIIKALLLLYNRRIISNIIAIIILSLVYYGLDKYGNQSFSKEELKYYDFLSFSTVVHFTLGFREIFPVSNISRIVVILHKLIFWYVNFKN